MAYNGSKSRGMTLTGPEVVQMQALFAALKHHRVLRDPQIEKAAGKIMRMSEDKTRRTATFTPAELPRMCALFNFLTVNTEHMFVPEVCNVALKFRKALAKVEHEDAMEILRRRTAEAKRRRVEAEKRQAEEAELLRLKRKKETEALRGTAAARIAARKEKRAMEMFNRRQMIKAAARAKHATARNQAN